MADTIGSNEPTAEDAPDPMDRLERLTDKNFRSNTAISARLDEMDSEVKSLYKGLLFASLSLAGIMLILWVQEKDIKKLKKAVVDASPKD